MTHGYDTRLWHTTMTHGYGTRHTHLFPVARSSAVPDGVQHGLHVLAVLERGCTGDGPLTAVCAAGERLLQGLGGGGVG